MAREPEIIFQPELGCLCGSDLIYFEADYPEYPPLLGHSLHEMIGTIVDTNGTRFAKGERVLSVPVDQVGLFSRYRVAEGRTVAIPPGLADEQAVLAQPLGTVLYAMRKLPNVVDWNVAVVGQGPIGQLFCATLRNLGARQIIALDRIDSRLETSRRMGATATINVDREDAVASLSRLTGGRMADLVVEAVGHRDLAINQCVELCRELGHLLAFGVPMHVVDGLNWARLFRKNITVHTSVGPDFERDFPLAMRWIAEGRIDVGPIVTHRMPVERIQTAFDLFSQRGEHVLKVFLDFPSG